MTKLPTLGDTKRINCSLWANCAGPYCGRGVQLDLEALINRYGDGYIVCQPQGFMARMKCTRCGHVGAMPTIIPVEYRSRNR